MYYKKEQDERNIQIAERNKSEADTDVKLAIKFVKTVKLLKITCAVLIAISYFFIPQYLIELLVIGILLALLLSQGFMDTYLEKLIELRSAETDERQILNASESNYSFSLLHEKIDKLESDPGRHS